MGYKTRKTQRDNRSRGYDKHVLIPATPAKDHCEHVNCSPLFGGLVNKRFKVKKIRSGDRLPAKTVQNYETVSSMPYLLKRPACAHH